MLVSVMTPKFFTHAGISIREFLCINDMAAASVHVLLLDNEIYKANT